MKINIQYVRMAISEALNSYIEQHLKKLSKKYEWVISADVTLKLDHNDHQNGKICTMELSLPGPRIFASSNEKNYEMAVKNTIKDLEVQLKKRKHVFSTH